MLKWISFGLIALIFVIIITYEVKSIISSIKERKKLEEEEKRKELEKGDKNNDSKVN